MVYVRKEIREDDYGRDESPHHRRHIAEGVIAGVGAAELLRHHKGKQGGDTAGGLSRVAKDAGAGVLGAVAAEGITRARSHYRSKSRRRERSRSRSRTRSDSRETRKSRSHRHRSRSESNSRLKKLGGLALGAGALAAVAVAAQRKNNKANESVTPDRRSRSRRRRGDEGSGSSDAPPEEARNPGHRNKRIAEAGAAGAVVAGLLEGARARSQARKGERSRSRLRQGLEVAAAGLGSAAIAGFYEKNKAKKETEAAEKAGKAARREARSRSRSRSRPGRNDPYYDGSRNASMNDPGLIEYGNGPMYGNIPQADYYGRPAQQENYYADAMVPTAAAAAGYGAAHEQRSGSLEGGRPRDRSVSSHSSSGAERRRRRRHRKHKSRSPSRDVGTPVVAGGLAGAAAASGHGQRKQRKREEKARRRKLLLPYPTRVHLLTKHRLCRRTWSRSI